MSESSWMNPVVRPLAGALETTLQAAAVAAAAAVFFFPLLPHLLIDRGCSLACDVALKKHTQKPKPLPSGAHSTTTAAAATKFLIF